jgi:YtfJ family uncharacterized protein
MMRKVIVLMAGLTCLWGAAQGLAVGQKVPAVEITDRGALVPATRGADGRMVLTSQELGTRTWSPREMLGRVWTLYHLAARVGVDDINKPYIDALIAARLPEFTPDGAYKTVTVLNLGDALWGTAGMGRSRLEKSQRDFPHAIHVDDEKGLARVAWGLRTKGSAVALVDRDGTVLFLKEGKLTPEEIGKVLALIKERLAHP